MNVLPVRIVTGLKNQSPPLPPDAPGLPAPRQGPRRLFAIRASSPALCEPRRVISPRQSWRTWAGLLMLVGLTLAAPAQPAPRPAESFGPRGRVDPSGPGASTQETNRPGTLNYNSSFRMIAERNIFNANRYPGGNFAGGRQPRIETVSLTGTMSYEKGQFAFFEGTSSEFTQTLKTDGMIAGFKVLDVAANSVKLQAQASAADPGTNAADASPTVIELPVGYQLRRQDGGPWQVAMTIDSAPPSERESGGDSGFRRDSGGGRNFVFGRTQGSQDSGGQNGGFNRRNRDFGNSGSGSTINPGAGSGGTSGGGSGADPATILQRLMQQRQQQLTGSTNQ